MTDVASRGAEPPLRPLFAGPERWGWEFRPPSRFVPPYPRPAPALPVLPPAWTAPARIVERLCLLRAVLLGFDLLAVTAAALLRHYEPRLTASLATNQPPAWGPASAELAVAVSSAVALVAVALTGLALLALLPARWAAHRSLRGWLAGTVRAAAEHERAHADWADAAARHTAAAAAEVDRRPRWFPVSPPGLRRLDVFGGTPEGWQAFLLSSGTSLLAAGGWLGVIDLSGDGVAAGLLAEARRHGCRSETVALPADAAAVDALAGLNPAAVADLLAETVHAHEASDGVDPAPSGIDARVLGAVCGALSGRLTVGRICAGLRVLLHQEPVPHAGSVLTAEEYDRVSAAFSDTFRRAVESRAVALEAVLHQLAELGERAAAGPVEESSARLQVVEVAADTPRLPAGLLVQLMLQLLLARTTPVGGSGSRTLVLAGADQLRRRHLARLEQLATRSGVRLVCLFRHLHDEAAQWLGAADVVYLMRLGNATEAAAAAEFIGREHKVLLHSLTLTATAGGSESTESSRSTQFQRGVTASYGGSGRSSSHGESRTTGMSTGDSTSVADAAGRQRVYEFAVEPTVLQSLPPTAFVYVEAASAGGPRARTGDCDPRIGSLAQVSAEPARRRSAR